MEIKTTMVTCPNGHHYDSSKHASCPYCGSAAAGYSQTAQFQPTEAPGSQNYNGGSFSETIAPGNPVGYNQNNGNFSATIAPDQPHYSNEPFGSPTQIAGDRADGDIAEPVVGWLVCIEGPARGTDYRLHAGFNYIGRETGDIRIHGDQQISRENHAMIAYDNDDLMFYVGPFAGRNIIKVNGKAVLTAVELHAYDIFSIGTTKLIFVPLCGEHFSWRKNNE